MVWKNSPSAFDARLLALSRTQELLTRGSTVSVRLEDTLRQELKAHGADQGSRVLLSGPDVRLLPKVAQALGMAFHELATNASKYGALGHDGRTHQGELADGSRGRCRRGDRNLARNGRAHCNQADASGFWSGNDRAQPSLYARWGFSRRVSLRRGGMRHPLSVCER